MAGGRPRDGSGAASWSRRGLRDPTIFGGRTSAVKPGRRGGVCAPRRDRGRGPPPALQSAGNEGGCAGSTWTRSASRAAGRRARSTARSRSTWSAPSSPSPAPTWPASWACGAGRSACSSTSCSSRASSSRAPRARASAGASPCTSTSRRAGGAPWPSTSAPAETSMMVTDLLGHPLLDVTEFPTGRQPAGPPQGAGARASRRVRREHPEFGECVGIGVVVSGMVDPDERPPRVLAHPGLEGRGPARAAAGGHQAAGRGRELGEGLRAGPGLGAGRATCPATAPSPS